MTQTKKSSKAFAMICQYETRDEYGEDWSGKIFTTSIDSTVSNQG